VDSRPFTFLHGSGTWRAPLGAFLYEGLQWAPLHHSQTKADWLYTFLTLAKVVETFLLYHYGSRRIFWVTGVTWASFFLSATILQFFNLGRASYFSKQNKCIDIVAGKLPTPQAIGGERKVLFDVPINLRKSRLWQAFWATGSIICVCSLVSTYALLTKEPVVCFHIWVTFQIPWLSLRSIFFHFARQTNDMKHIITPAITEKHRPTQLNFRLLGLAVIGDTLLSSVAWLMGSPLTGMDLYDCCILVLRSSDKTLLIPACRVLSGRFDTDQDIDPELTMPSSFLPKGVSNSGTDTSWRYWIPCGENKWVYYSTPWTTLTKQSLGITGKKEMVVTSGENITEELRTGKLLVSLSNVKDVEDAVARSAAVARILREMLLGTPGIKTEHKNGL